MEPLEPPLNQLVRDGQVNEVLRIIRLQLRTREIFLQHMGSYLQQFIGIAANRGYIEILQCCVDYDVGVTIDHSIGLDAIAEAASQGHDHVIEWFLQPWIADGRQINGTVYSNRQDVPKGWLCPSLHRAVQGKHLSTVKLLIHQGWADVDACDENGTKPVDRIAISFDKDNPGQMLSYEEIVEVLVTAKARIIDINPLTNTTLLCDAVSRDSFRSTKILIDGGADVFAPIGGTRNTVLHLAAKSGFYQTLRVMLEHNRLSEFVPKDFDVTDENGWTPLHAAISGGHLNCIRILIKKGLSLVAETTNGKTVMQALFKHVQQPVTFLTEILDEQVSMPDNCSHDVTLNFRVLAPDNTPEMTVVAALINALPNLEQMTILQHPLLETYIHQQYSRTIGLNIFLLAAHILFSVLLSLYVNCIESLDFPCILVTMMMLAIPAEVMFAENIARGRIDRLNFVIHVFLWVVLPVSLLNNYFNKSVCDSPPILHVMAVMILLSWINTMLVLRRFPLIGDWAFMFFTVLANVAKVLFCFVCLILGFALSFSVLLSRSNEFNTVWKSVVKTMVMMTGEYNYSELFSTVISTSTKKDDTPLPITSIAVFLTFVIVTSIALMNLMIALAVNDIQILLKEGRTRRLLKQVECTFLTEYYCTFLIRTIGSTMTLDVRSSSWIPWREICSDVKKALYDLAVKNFNRDKERSTASICNNTEDSLAEMKFLQQELIKEVQRLNIQMLKVLENRDNERQ